ncbi:MAG: hypothetical protein WKG07_02180 [Hymenobacter sp.]
MSELALGTATFGADPSFGAEAAGARRIWRQLRGSGRQFHRHRGRVPAREAGALVGQFVGADRGDFVLASGHTCTAPIRRPVLRNSATGHRKAMRQG